MNGKLLNYGKRCYILTSPRNEKVFAGRPYRELLMSRFDFVLVENGCFLEPNYLIIENINASIDEQNVKDLNLIPKDSGI